MDLENGRTTMNFVVHKIIHSKTQKWLFRIGCALCIVFMLATVVLAILYGINQSHGRSLTSDSQGEIVWPTRPESVLGNFSNAAVAADNGICSEIGRNILIRGGNAVDTMIATLLCIGVMDAHSSGLGGGHLMTIYNRTTKSCIAIDSREAAPKASTSNMFANNSDASRIGWLAMGVPGEIYGLYTAYKLGASGKIPWRDLVTPAADLCQFGYPVSGALAKAIQQERNNILKEETLKEIFFNKETNDVYAASEIMRRPALAATLYELARASDPIQWFYNSTLTKTMADEFQKYGGIITLDDFREYRSKYGNERPIITTKVGSDLVACGPPPPSSAAVTLAVLNVMQGYDINESKLENLDYEIDIYHKWLETFKFVYGVRTRLGDMDFVKDALAIARNITSPEYGAFVRSMITDHAHNDVNYYLQGPKYSSVEDHGTAHVSVLDEEGNAVSVTSTVNLYFGSHTVSPSTGIIWNCEMDDFSNPNAPNYFGFAPSSANLIEPGKKPVSSMSPVIVYDSKTGDVRIVTGAAGGSRIISMVSQLIMRLLWFGENVRVATEKPRLHNQLQPLVSEAPGFPKIYIDKLIERGQTFTKENNFSTAATSIHRADDGRIYANSDYRKSGGYPAGF